MSVIPQFNVTRFIDIKTNKNQENLKKLQENDSSLFYIDDILESYARLIILSLPLNQHLRCLDLTLVKLSNHNCKSLKSMLQCNVSLMSLKLRSNNTNDAQLRCILEGMIYNTNLINLKISTNKFGLESDKTLDDILRINTTLQKLKIQDIYLDGSDMFCFMHGLWYNTTLLSLNILNLNMSHSNLSTLGEYLMNNNTLETFKLRTFGLAGASFSNLYHFISNTTALKTLILEPIYGDDLHAWKSLDRCLSNNKSITSLSVFGMTLWKADVPILLSLLDRKTELTTLKLTTASINDDKALKIASWLSTNTTITNLDLSGNNIHSLESALGFADMLRVNTTLTRLNLAANNTISHHNEEIIKALTFNTTLVELELYSADKHESQAIIEVIEQNQTLTSLILRCHMNNLNFYHSNYWNIVKSSMRHNTTLSTLILPTAEGLPAPHPSIIAKKNYTLMALLLNRWRREIKYYKDPSPLPSSSSSSQEREEKNQNKRQRTIYFIKQFQQMIFESQS